MQRSFATCVLSHVLSNIEYLNLWDFRIHCDHEIKNRMPGIVLIEKEGELCWIIVVLCHADKEVGDK